MADLSVISEKLSVVRDVIRTEGLPKLEELVLRICRFGRHGEAQAPDVVAAQRFARRRLDPIAPERPERLPLFRDVGEGEAGPLQEAPPDVEMISYASNRQ